MLKKEENVMSSNNWNSPTLLLECGFKPTDAYFEIHDDEVKECQKFNLDRLRLDTCCLNDPEVKLDFTCLVVFEAEDERGSEHEVKVDLLFKLKRKCHGDEEIVESWRYLYELEIEDSIDELEVGISQSFAVSTCDKPYPCECEYIMTVEGVDFEGDFEQLRVIKPNLTALAKSQCN